MWQRETFKKIKQIPGEEHVLPGSALCAGCGGLESLRLAAKVLGDDVVYVNAAGCFTMLAAYPYIEREDILQALTYAAWRSEEKDLPLVS